MEKLTMTEKGWGIVDLGVGSAQATSLDLVSRELEREGKSSLMVGTAWMRQI